MNYWTKQEEQFLKETLNKPTVDVAKALNRNVPAVLAKRRRLGLKKPNKKNFKKGVNNSPKTKKVGEIYIKNIKGEPTYYIKYAANERPKRYHIWRWEQLNGKIPKKHLVWFKDGNRMNIKDENLILLSFKDRFIQCMKSAEDDRVNGILMAKNGWSFVDLVLSGRMV